MAVHTAKAEDHPSEDFFESEKGCVEQERSKRDAKRLLYIAGRRPILTASVACYVITTHIFCSDKLAFPSIYDPASITLSVVVPAYNEEKRIAVMMDVMLDVLEKESKKNKCVPCSNQSQRA